MRPADVRVVFMGSPQFAVPSLQALIAAGYRVVAVVTQPDRPAGRGGRLTPPPVKEVAEAAGIPVLQPESLKDEAVQAQLAALQPDLFVVAAYGKILPRAVLAIPTQGCVNVHASLLPRWRGASPIAAAILAGDAETGVTIMEMAPKMDAGAVILQRSEAIAPGDTTGTLELRLAAAGAATLIEALPGWYDRTVIATPQDEDRVTYCSLVEKEHGRLSIDQSAVEADRAVRAYDPWPGAFVTYRGQRLGIWRAHVLPDSSAPGTLRIIDRAPAIAFREGTLVLDEVQKPGGRRLSGPEFLNGERGVLAPALDLP